MRYVDILAESLSTFEGPKPRSKSPKSFTIADNLVIWADGPHIQAYNGSPFNGGRGLLIGDAYIMRGSPSSWHDGEEPDKNWHIINVGVKAPYRGKGLGKVLYDACEAYANSRGGILVPATSVSDDAYRLWKSWKPERIAYDHRPYDKHYVGKHVMYKDREWVITRAAQTFEKSPFFAKLVDEDTTTCVPKKVVFDQLGDFYA